jgi:hypothetical protein
MSVRLQKKILLVHVNKTGGTTIHAALGRRQRHRSVQELIQKHGRKYFDKCFCAATARNTYDRAVSQYFYRIESEQDSLHVNPLTFEEWVVRTFEEHDPQYFQDNKLFWPQVRWMVDHEGRWAVNYVLMQHRLQEDFNRLCRLTGRPRKRLPHLRQSKHGHYSQYYTPRAKRVIENWFAPDIDKWKFAFKSK